MRGAEDRGLQGVGDADPYKGGAEYDLAWILSYRAGAETRPYKPSQSRVCSTALPTGEPSTGDASLPIGRAKYGRRGILSICCPAATRYVCWRKLDILLPAVILSAVELLRRDSDSLCSSLLRSSIPLRSTQNDTGAKARDEVAAGSRAAIRYTPCGVSPPHPPQAVPLLLHRRRLAWERVFAPSQSPTVTALPWGEPRGRGFVQISFICK